MKKTTTKKIVTACLVNGFLWVWASYALALLGREDIAEGLSKTAITEIVAVVFVYCCKALFEKQERFGGIGSGGSCCGNCNSSEERGEPQAMSDCSALSVSACGAASSPVGGAKWCGGTQAQVADTDFGEGESI